MTTPDACPTGPPHPRSTRNAPGRRRLDYRVGDFDSFRRALLQPEGAEGALAEWRGSVESDLAVQMIDWWAYLADILAFYNERVLEGALLPTARHPEDVRRIVRLLGYRPRPGIGATGVVAALTDSPRPFVVPRGLPIQGRSAPGSPEQVFEVDADIEVGRLGHPLPRSTRIPSIPGQAGTRWTGPGPVDEGGKLVDHVPATAPVEDVRIVAGREFEVSLRGAITTVQPDDVILLLPRNRSGGQLGHANVLVRAVEHAWDAVGRALTTLTLLPDTTLEDVGRDDLRIMRPTQLAHLWLYHQRYPQSGDINLVATGTIGAAIESVMSAVLTGGLLGGNPLADLGPPEDPRVLTGMTIFPLANGLGHAHLEAITRGIKAGDPVLFESLGEGGGLFGLFTSFMAGLIPGLEEAIPRSVLVEVAGYSEELWYANEPQLDHVGHGPPVGPPRGPDGLIGSLVDGAEGPIPIPHSKITFVFEPTIDLMVSRGLDTIVARYGWEEVGEVVEPDSTEETETVTVAASDGVPQDAVVPVLIEDANGEGTAGHLGRAGLVIDRPVRPPLRALLHLLPVSRGSTVEREILGSGDPMVAGQEFTLQRAPLTYLTDTGPEAVNGYRSTLRIRVDGVEWREVPTFHGEPPDAEVFVTREDAEHRTHVRFGDGANGRRLPAGVDNVVARYRHGSGAEPPIPGSLTSVLRPVDGITSVRNPVPVGGGEDPEPPERLRRLAPSSVLAFGRVVSATDYETVAAQTPGVRRARSTWGWHAPSQRMLVKVHVGDDEAAVEAARDAFAAFADPNRPVVVERAVALHPTLDLTLLVDPRHDPVAVEQRLRGALLDAGATPFGRDAARIGQVIYDSHISLACTGVAGVVGLDSMTLSIGGRALPGERHDPGEGRFFLLRPDDLHILLRQANP